MIYDICIPLHGNFIWADENYISLLFSGVPHFQTNPDSLDPLDHLFFFWWERIKSIPPVRWCAWGKGGHVKSWVHRLTGALKTARKGRDLNA